MVISSGRENLQCFGPRSISWPSSGVEDFSFCSCFGSPKSNSLLSFLRVTKTFLIGNGFGGASYLSHKHVCYSLPIFSQGWLFSLPFPFPNYSHKLSKKSTGKNLQGYEFTFCLWLPGGLQFHTNPHLTFRNSLKLLVKFL